MSININKITSMKCIKKFPELGRRKEREGGSLKAISRDQQPRVKY